MHRIVRDTRKKQLAIYTNMPTDAGKPLFKTKLKPKESRLVSLLTIKGKIDESNKRIDHYATRLGEIGKWSEGSSSEENYTPK